MVTEADPQAWTPEQLKPYYDVALECFGPSRLMFGSDWPVCLLGCDYRRWVEVVNEWAAPLSPDERDQLFGQTAVRVYQLEK